MESQQGQVEISLAVNNRVITLTLPAEETLLFTLRERLSLKGTKNGCDEGVCGSCTILVDGRAMRACKLKTAQLDGAKVTTIEGVAQSSQLHPIQDAFIREGAIGCGFCTPGMVMAALALLETDPRPSEEQIKRALQPNLCRCVGYWPIVRAIRRVTGQPVERHYHAVGQVPSMRVVGQDVPRVDAVEKVTGQAVFADDLDFPDMLYAATVRSAHPYARIRGVDPSSALSLPDVVTVLTARDIPGENAHGKTVADQPILAADAVSYYGQPIALVAAQSLDVARQAAEQVVVDYDPLLPVLTAEEALSLGGANILHQAEVSRGDTRRGFEEAAVVVEDVFRTQRTDPLFLEPPAGVARIDAQEQLVLHAACQYPYGIRRQIARALAIGEDQVRVLQTTCGGAFGGKVEASVHLHLALLAWRLRRPVKMVYTRQETFLGTVKRHPMIMRYRVGADADGKLTAMEIRILADTGAFETSVRLRNFRTVSEENEWRLTTSLR